jgi:hypothetical protein
MTLHIPMFPPSDRTGAVIQLAVSNPIITHAELAAVEFEPEAYFVGFDKNPRPWRSTSRS